MLCSNLECHFNSAGHKKCAKVTARVIVTKGQKPLSASFGNSIKDGIIQWVWPV